MTEPEPTQPEPTDDPGHVLPQEVWDKVVADRDRIEARKREADDLV